MSSNWYWWAYWTTQSPTGRLLKGIKGCANTELELIDMMTQVGKLRNDYETVCLDTRNEDRAKHAINDLIAKKIGNIDAVLTSRYRSIPERS